MGQHSREVKSTYQFHKLSNFQELLCMNGSQSMFSESIIELVASMRVRTCLFRLVDNVKLKDSLRQVEMKMPVL